MRFTDVIIIIPLLLITAVAGFALGRQRRVAGRAGARAVPGPASPAWCGRVPRPARAGVRRRRPGRRRSSTGGSSSSTSCRTPSATIVVSMTLLMGAGILTEAALGFLGFGIQPPDVSLGSLVSALRRRATTRPWLFIWPGVFIIVIVLCLQFIGDGLRDAFDPRQKRIPKRKDLEPGRGVDEPAAETSPMHGRGSATLARSEQRRQRRPARSRTRRRSDRCRRASVTAAGRTRAAGRPGDRRRAAPPMRRTTAAARPTAVGQVAGSDRCRPRRRWTPAGAAMSWRSSGRRRAGPAPAPPRRVNVP